MPVDKKCQKRKLQLTIQQHKLSVIVARKCSLASWKKNTDNNWCAKAVIDFHIPVNLVHTHTRDTKQRLE